jgi:hypothetical protein
MFSDSLSFRCRATAVCTALGIASALAGAATMVAPTAADAASCSLSQMSSTSQPACWQPFSAGLFNGGPFNYELSSNPALAPNSAAVVSHMTSNNWSFGYPGYGGFALGSDGSRPVFFAKSSDPTMNIVCLNAFGPGSCTGNNGVNIGGQTIHVPAGLQPEDGTDAHLTVVETATGQEYDMWGASISGSTISIQSGSVVNTNTGTGLWAQGDAANFALTAGLLRPSELASGTINHALVITVPCTNANGSDVGYSYPAAGGWGETCGDYWNESPSGAPMLGQQLRLNMTDAQIADSGAPVWQQTIMTAMAHYGAYIEDTDGGWNSGMNILMQQSNSWTDVGQPDPWTALATQYGYTDGMLSSNVPIPVSQLQVVSACVSLARCPNSVASQSQAAVKSSSKVTESTAMTSLDARVTRLTTNETATNGGAHHKHIDHRVS